MKFRFNKLRVIVAFAAGLLLASCEIESQNLKSYFADGKVPITLQRVANQFYETRAVQERVKAAALKNSDPNYLKVAVMDNGIDLSHPDLLDKIAYTVRNGRVVGAGFDVMGGDLWPSHQLVNPTLYAFGAKDVKDGKIVGAPKNPLAEMERINNGFIDGLIAKVKADPQLKDSLFAKKLTPDSLSIFGAHAYLKDNDEFDREAYEKALKRGILIDGNRPRPIPDGFAPEGFLRLALEDWKMSDKGIPEGTSGYWEWAKGGDRFHELLKSHFEEYAKSSGYSKALENYISMQRGADFAIGKSMGEKIEEALKPLAKAHYYKKYGALSADPRNKVAKGVRDDLVIRQVTAPGKNLTVVPKAITGSQVRKHIEESLAIYRDYVESVDRIDSLDQAVREKVDQLKKDLPRIEALLNDYLANDENLERLADGRPPKSNYRYERDILRRTHPFINENSAAESHGSHVAGIISKQAPDARIVPVRVTTQGQALTDAMADKIGKEFYRDFEKWLNDPVVFRAMADLVKGSMPEMARAATDPVQRASAAKSLLEMMRPSIEKSLKAKGIDHLFLSEVLTAIRYIGREKIKVANVSLGTSFESAVGVPEIKDAKQQLDKLFGFLRTEFFKYKVAETIEKDAKGTIFVVATGNDGKWVDGRSRSALPVDLSSPFLSKYEDAAKQERVPNNRIRNILAVGSINKEANLSSFTNLPLSPNTTFVLAHGEEILSPVRMTDNAGFTGIVNEVIPSLKGMDFKPVDEGDARLADLLKKYGTNKGESELDQLINRLSLSQRLMSIKTLTEAATDRLASEYPIHRAKMSGTSMATPTSSGLLADQIVNEARAKGLKPGEIYDHPDFAPDKVLDRLVARAKPIAAGARGIAFQALLDDKTWEEDPMADRLRKRLRADSTPPGVLDPVCARKFGRL